MNVKCANGMFRCDDACCKNFASYEIMVGGAVGRVSFCDKHFLELLKESKSLIKPISKSNNH